MWDQMAFCSDDWVCLPETAFLSKVLFKFKNILTNFAVVVNQNRLPFYFN